MKHVFPHMLISNVDVHFNKLIYISLGFFCLIVQPQPDETDDRQHHAFMANYTTLGRAGALYSMRYLAVISVLIQRLGGKKCVV